MSPARTELSSPVAVLDKNATSKSVANLSRTTHLSSHILLILKGDFSFTWLN
jgi:hypothetical protein